MSLDLALFRFINITLGWDGLAPVMHVASKLVYFVPLILVLVLWMLIRDGKRGRVTVLVLVLLIPAADQLSSHVLKPLVGRPRPCRPEAGIEGVKTHGSYCSGKGSFPSSHATNIAAVAFLLAMAMMSFFAGARALWTGQASTASYILVAILTTLRSGRAINGPCRVERHHLFPLLAAILAAAGAAAALAAGDAKGLGELLAAHVEALSDRDQAQAEGDERRRIEKKEEEGGVQRIVSAKRPGRSRTGTPRARSPHGLRSESPARRRRPRPPPAR